MLFEGVNTKKKKNAISEWITSTGWSQVVAWVARKRHNALVCLENWNRKLTVPWKKVPPSFSDLISFNLSPWIQKRREIKRGKKYMYKGEDVWSSGNSCWIGLASFKLKKNWWDWQWRRKGRMSRDFIFVREETRFAGRIGGNYNLKPVFLSWMM